MALGTPGENPSLKEIIRKQLESFVEADPFKERHDRPLDLDKASETLATQAEALGILDPKLIYTPDAEPHFRVVPQDQDLAKRFGQEIKALDVEQYRALMAEQLKQVGGHGASWSWLEGSLGEEKKYPPILIKRDEKPRFRPAVGGNLDEEK